MIFHSHKKEPPNIANRIITGLKNLPPSTHVSWIELTTEEFAKFCAEIRDNDIGGFERTVTGGWLYGNTFISAGNLHD